MFEMSDTVDRSHIPVGVTIHPSALVHAKAQLGTNVVIGPFATIGPKVVLHDGVKVGSHAAIQGRTTVGAQTVVHSFASLGTDPQDLKYKGQDTELEIGTLNQVREYVNISLGTETGGGKTRIGNQNLIMAYTHIAHDVTMGNECILANGVQLAGHVFIGNHAVFGGMSGGHQFCRFGDYVMVAAGAIVVQDVLPYCMVQGDRATVNGLNVVGLKRAGIREEHLQAIKNMYRLVFKSNLTVEDALLAIEKEVAPLTERERFVTFLKGSRRGICR